MQAIQAKDYKVVFNAEGYAHINTLLQANSYSVIFVLVDSNTYNYCLAPFLANIETTSTIEVIEIDAGEEFKNLETCSGVWSALSELNGDRRSLMINLGGGVVTDLGGFIACAFKRGIDFINVPTTLLAMVDASIGGKTGVDLGPIKNQIGIIRNPKAVLVNIDFLGTLPVDELRSGYAEMLKHGLISNQEYWDAVTNSSYENIDILTTLVHQSIEIKNKVVAEDPYEQGLRKTLNYGHTLGHAIESYYLSNPNKKRLLHGEAIAIGMILANFLSTKLTGLNLEKCNLYSTLIAKYYPQVSFDKEDINQIIDLLKFDKKNEGGKVYFVLLKAIGDLAINIEVPNEMIFNAFEYYTDIYNKN